MVIVDTTVWVDYFRGAANPETDWVHAALDRQRLGLTDLILGGNFDRLFPLGS